MATFKYTAFDENEKNLKGFINASDSDEARLILINRGLNPLNIEKTLQKRSKVLFCWYLFFWTAFLLTTIPSIEDQS